MLRENRARRLLYKIVTL
ncbi:hypothetical protein [Bacillus salipaludis]|uniref:Uncharacterized protein n=1 Tax=Bacillus salipaludis TaxID=2547811 RepID=A0ABW8RKA8_9BACI